MCEIRCSLSQKSVIVGRNSRWIPHKQFTAVCKKLMFHRGIILLSGCLSNKQDAQLLQRDRAAGCISFGQSVRMGLGYDVCGHYRSIFNHCDIIGLQSYRIRWKTQNKGYYAGQGHSRSPTSVPIESSYVTSYKWLMQTGILSPTVSKLLQIIVQIVDILRFWATLWGLTGNVHCSP